MSFQFECASCDAVTIFKEIEQVPKHELTCANCDKGFDIKKDLTRFDRRDKYAYGALSTEDGSLETRIRKLIDQFEQIEERCEKLEYLILDQRGEITHND